MLMRSLNKRVAAVVGADTRVGSRLVDRLPSHRAGLLPQPSSWSVGRSSQQVTDYLAEKMPSVVFNCSIDPDGGDMPYDVAAYVAATDGMLRYCQQNGARYVHASSSRLYGPTDKPANGIAYSEWDTVLLGGNDPWRNAVAAVERQIMSRVMFTNPTAMESTDGQFGFYVLRFGHVTSFDEMRTERFSDLLTLSEFATASTGRDMTVACDFPDSYLSPISADFAADCLCDLVSSSCLAPYGFYNIGAETPITLRQVCLYLAKRSGQLATFVPCGDGSRIRCLYGFDGNQAVRSDWWLKQRMRKVLDWKAAFVPLLKRLAAA